MSNPHNGPGLGTVSAFNDSWNGTLSSIGASPFADNQTAPCWLVISHDGERLYALNTGTGSVSACSIAADGTLTLLASTPLSSPVGAITGTDVALSSDDSTLYVNEAENGTVGTFAINPDGTLTQLIHGRITISTGSTQPFHGWLELASKLEGALSSPARTPIAAPPSARNVR